MRRKTIAELPIALSALEANLVMKAINAHTDGQHPTATVGTLPFFTLQFAAEMVQKAIKAGQISAHGDAIMAKLSV